jgi:opacity protein-like surface antigen
MSRAFRVALVAAVLGGMLASSAEAQRRRGLVDVTPAHERRGFWMEGGLGWGREAYKFDDEPGWSESLSKPTFTLALGGTPHGGLRLGGQVTGWWNRYQDEDGFHVTETLTSVLAVGRFYPSRRSGLHLKAGAGLGVSGADVSGGVGTTETGFAYTLGGGYEIQLSPHLFLTPAVDWTRFSFEQRGEPTLRERLLNLSLSVTWQPGR